MDRVRTGEGVPGKGVEKGVSGQGENWGGSHR